MNDMQQYVRLGLRTACLLAAAALMLWALYPAAKPYAAGFLLGLLFSLINGWYLAAKVRQIGEMAAKQAVKARGLGFFLRAALSVMAVAIAVKNDQYDVLATIIGLLYAYIFVFTYGLISHMRSRRG